MSGLPISPTLAPTLPLRDALPPAQPAPTQTAVAVVRTQTASAIQQLPSASQLEALARQVLSSGQDRRSRLVGPPPTFEVNLLQHLRETRMDHDAQAAREMPGDADTKAPEHAGYAEIHGLQAREDREPDLQMDRSV